MDEKTINIFKCSECEHTDDHVKYNVQTTSHEYGTAVIYKNSRGENDIDYDDSDYGDSDWDGSPTYECPSCENEFDRNEINELFTEYKITQKTFTAYQKGEITLNDIINGDTKIPASKEKEDCGSVVIKNAHRAIECESSFNFGTECPKCHAIQAVDPREENITCNYCNKEFNKTKLNNTMYA